MPPKHPSPLYQGRLRWLTYTPGQPIVVSLNERTQEWLRMDRSAVRWNQKDTNVARSLLEEWMRVDNEQPEKARGAIKIYYQWLESAHYLDSGANHSVLIESLNWILNGWKQADDSFDAVQQALQAIRTTLERARRLKNVSLIPQDKTFSIVFDIMAMHPSREAILHARRLLAERMELHVLPEPDLQFWNCYLNILAKYSSLDRSLVDEAETLVDRLGDRADDRTIASLLEAWGHSGRPEAGERAQARLDAMLSRNQINAVCFTLTSNAWAVSGRPQEAEDCLMQMIRHGEERRWSFEVDERPFLVVLRSWGRCGEAERAEDLLEFMLSMYESMGNPELRPTSECFLAVLNAWAQRGNAGPKVERLLQRAIENLTRPTERGLILPSARAFTVAIKAWSKTGAYEAPERAEALLNQMDELKEAGFGALSPNAFHVSATISSWTQSERNDAPERALLVLRRYAEKIGPSTVVYNAAMSALARHARIKEAENLLQEMTSGRSCVATPDTISYTTLIHSYYSTHHDNAMKRSLELLHEMEDSFDRGNFSVQPTEAAYHATALVQSLGSVEKAEAVLWRMQNRFENDSRCAAPTVSLCNLILHLWANSHESVAPQRAQLIFRHMYDTTRSPTDALYPNGESYLSLAQTWMRSRRRSAARKVKDLLQVLKTSASVPLSFHTREKLALTVEAIEAPANERRELHEVFNSIPYI